MKNIAGLLTFLCLMAAMGWYCPLIVRRRITPAPATWIVGSIALNLAVLSYHAIPGRTVIENVLLYFGAFNMTVVSGLLMAVLYRSRELRVTFDWVQKACLAVMTATLIYWAFNKNRPDITFWTTQILLVVSYIATIMKAIQHKTAFDSIGNWGFVFVECVIGTIPAVMMLSPYGIVNSIRAVASSGITVLVLVYFDSKNDNARWKDEKKTLADFYKIR